MQQPDLRFLGYPREGELLKGVAGVRTQATVVTAWRAGKKLNVV